MSTRMELFHRSSLLWTVVVLCWCWSAAAADSPLDLDPDGFLQMLEQRDFERLNANRRGILTPL